MSVIPYGRHSINDDDIDAVVDVLKNRFLTQGDQGPLFEKALCDYTGAAFCTALNSATSGLHVACMALGVNENDTVWTSANSFAASANCARYCGAEVDFVDIDVTSGNICINALKKKLIHAKAHNLLPKVLIVVHFAGISCDMKSIKTLCDSYGIMIIEDAAHALGATYDGFPVGDCRYSEMAVVSFHPVKSITSAEGGAVLCNDEQLAVKCQLFAKHGITKSPSQFTIESEGNWFYQQLELGYNYRLSDLHAALGISQLKRLDNFIKKRREIAQKYFTEFDGLPLKTPPLEHLHTASWHLYVIQVTSEKRADIFATLQEQGIGVNVHYIPIYKHPYYQSTGFDDYSLDNMELYYSRAISLPIYPDLDIVKQQKVIEIVKRLT